MDLIPGLILLLGALAIVSLLGWDTFQNRKQITRLKIQQSCGPKTYEQQGLIRKLFNIS